MMPPSRRHTQRPSAVVAAVVVLLVSSSYAASAAFVPPPPPAAVPSGSAVAGRRAAACRAACRAVRPAAALVVPLTLAAAARNDDMDDARDDVDDDAPPSSPSSAHHPPRQQPTRREALLRAVSLSTLAATTTLVGGRAQSASALDLDLPDFLLAPDRRTEPGVYKQGKRATAYLVDSTIPPTLVPFKASREASILKKLGQGSGTAKKALLQDRLTLNNMMQKAVYGTGKLAGDLARGGPEDPRSGRGYGSFVFLGVDYASGEDAGLAEGIVEIMVKPRERDRAKAPTALGLAFAPRSTQGALDRYLRGEETEAELLEELTAAAAPSDKAAAATFLPLLRFAKSKSLALLALAPEALDIQTIRTQGLQNVPIERRSQYVRDSEGFINLTQDPKFKLYTEKSLLRDFSPLNDKDSPGDYFAERILVHEACASAVAEWTVQRPDAFVVVVAPLQDVRYMGGSNGRVVRVCQYLDAESIVDEECVTTILLNPSAKTTLSASKFLRLEIGTLPTTIQYQTKVSDYLWFSTMPKVNMLPRMMNYA